MIVLSATNVNQPEQPVNVVSADAPKAVVEKVSEGSTPSPELLKQAVDDISQAAQQASHNLEFEFSMDTDTEKMVVKVVNTDTGELVRQMPSEEMIAIARSIDRFQRSVLLNQKA